MKIYNEVILQWDEETQQYITIYEDSVRDVLDEGKLADNLSGSGWSPYYNQIHLHRKQNEEPVLIANLPRAIQTRDDIDIVISFRMDH